MNDKASTQTTPDVPPAQSAPSSVPRWEWLLPTAFAVLFLVVLIRTAWVCDDAYITMRTVRNLVTGHGLRWNIAERVQAYTHPLWMFVLAGAYGISREPYYCIIVPSIVFSMAAMVLFAFFLPRSPAAGALAMAVLVFSKAFTDYSTSGLENPLTHFLLTVFMVIYLQPRPGPRRLFALSLVAALGMLNRMDTILLYGPALAYSWLETRTVRGTAAVAAGFVPLFVWEAFSLFYYGFPFPNTAYAKLSTGLEFDVLLPQAMAYFADSLRLDPLTLPAIAAGLIIVVIARWRRLLPLVAGVLLYLVYVVSIGGDFMSGRFFAAPLLLSAVCIARLDMRVLSLWWPAALGVVLVTGCLTPACTLWSGSDFGSLNRRGIIGAAGIADERAFYYRRTGLLKSFGARQWPDVVPEKANPPRNRYGLVVQHNTGIMGFFGAGQDTYVLDDYALSDPLLARLPVTGVWRIGHFQRAIPAGYVKTLGGNTNAIRHPALAAYYDRLRLITRGDLFSRERLRTIIDMNLKRFDPLLQSYIESLPPSRPVNRYAGKR